MASCVVELLSHRVEEKRGGAQMKVLVTYYTQTGNTERVAEAICDEIGDSAESKALADVESLDGYDLALVGFPIMAFSPAKPAKDFLEAHAAGKLAYPDVGQQQHATHSQQQEHDGVEHRRF